MLFVRSRDTVARGVGDFTARKLTGTPYFPYMGCRPMRVQHVGVTYLVYIYTEVYIRSICISSQSLGQASCSLTYTWYLILGAAYLVYMLCGVRICYLSIDSYMPHLLYTRRLAVTNPIFLVWIGSYVVHLFTYRLAVTLFSIDRQQFHTSQAKFDISERIDGI